MENLTESSPESDVEFSDDGEWVPSSEDSDDELCGWICANCTEVNDETPACQGRCKRLASRKATVEEMKTAHDEEHTRLDTYANEHTPLATRLAAAATVDVALALAKKEAAHGGAIVRPPGHHAERNGIMGFCMCNNAAVAVRAAQDAGAKRVLVVDWDVHHGNGTQNIFDRDPSVLYVSLHRFQHGRFYPGTGHPQEMGEGPGKGYSVNIAWNAGGVGDGDYITAFLQVVLPVAYEFAPDLTIVSAGFDAAAGDPLGGCSLTPAGYAHMTALLKPLAPVELLLEGGYNLRSISASAEACMHAAIQATIEAVGMCWESLSGVSALRVLSSSLPTQHAHPRENAALSVQGSAKEGSTANQLRAVDFQANQLRAVDFQANRLRAVDFQANQLRAVDFQA
eukprot:gene12965-15328_t